MHEGKRAPLPPIPPRQSKPTAYKIITKGGAVTVTESREDLVAKFVDWENTHRSRGYTTLLTWEHGAILFHDIAGINKV